MVGRIGQAVAPAALCLYVLGCANIMHSTDDFVCHVIYLQIS